MARTSSNASDASFNWGNATFINGATQALWSFWVNITTWNSSFQTLWSKDDYPTQNAGWGIQRNGSTDDIIWFTRGTSATNTVSFKSGADTFAGAGWIHLAVWSNNTSTNRTYRDGVFKNSASPRNPFGTNANNYAVTIDNSSVAIAELSVWVGVSQAQADSLVPMLAKGFCPTSMPIQVGSYCPLYGTGGTESDYVGTVGSSTVPGNSAQAAHPSLFQPAGQQLFDGAAAAVVLQSWPLETTGGPPVPGAPWQQGRLFRTPGRQVFPGGLAPVVQPVIAPQETVGGPPLRGSPWQVLRPFRTPGRQVFPGGAAPVVPLLPVLPLETIGGPPLPGSPWVYFRPFKTPGRQVFARGRAGPPKPGDPGGPPTVASGQPRVSRVPVTDPRRLARFTEQMSSIINSLIAQGILVQTGPDSWTLKLPPP